MGLREEDMVAEETVAVERMVWGEDGVEEGAEEKDDERGDGREEGEEEEGEEGGQAEEEEREIEGYEAKLAAGDALFIPQGWWHSVRGVGQGLTGSVSSVFLLFLFLFSQWASPVFSGVNETPLTQTNGVEGATR